MSALTKILDRAAEAAEQSPELKDKLLQQASQWGESAVNYLKDKISSNRIIKEQGLEDTFQKGMPGTVDESAIKSAQDSAQTLQKAPDVQLAVPQGPAIDASPAISSQQTGIIQRPAREKALVPFELPKGSSTVQDIPKPYYGETVPGEAPEALKSSAAEETAPVTASPEAGIEPSVTSEAKPKAVSPEAEVSPTEEKVPEKAPEEKPKESSKMSNAKKIAIGAGVGLTAAELAQQAASGEKSPAAQATPSAAAVLAQSDEAKSADTSKEEPQDFTDDENWDKANAVAASKIPTKTTTSKTPEHEASIAQQMMDFVSKNQAPDLNQAIQAQNDMIHQAEINRSANLLAAGLAGSHGIATKPIDTYKDDVAKSALPVEQFKLKQANEENDPNSGMSQGLRSYMGRLGIKVSDQATAAQIKQVVPYVFKDIEAKQAQQAKHEDLAMRAKEIAQRNKELSAFREQNRQDRLDKQQQQTDLKTSRDQDKAYENLGKAISSFRGNTAVQQAALGLKNSEAAMAIINSKPDYNNIDQTQYNTLTAEIAKIATGGAATEGSAHDLRAQTLMSRAAQFWQSVKGKPTGAQLGAFIQENKDYLEHLNEINNRYVNNFKADIYRGYQKHLHPDDRAEFEAAHPEIMETFHGQGKQKDQGPSIDMSNSQDKAALEQIFKNNPGISLADAVKALHNYKTGQ